MAFKLCPNRNGTSRDQNNLLIPLHVWIQMRIPWQVICIPASFPLRASLVAQRVKRLPAMQDTRVRFLGREDPLEKEMAIHSSTLAWKIPWTEEPDRLQSVGSPKSWTQLSDFTFTVFIETFQSSFISLHYHTCN